MHLGALRLGPHGALALLPCVAVFVAPIFGGFLDSMAYMSLALVALVMTTALLVRGNDFLVPFPAIGLFLLALFTLLQAVPLPPAVVELLSGRVLRLQPLGGEVGWLSVSYEPATTRLLAGIWFLYGVVICCTASIVRSRKTQALVIAAVMWAGVLTALVLFADRARVVDLSVRGGQPGFANPNHAASWLMLCAVVSAGLFVSRHRLEHRGIHAIATAILLAVCLGMVSKSVWVALAIAIFAIAFRLVKEPAAMRSADRKIGIVAAVLSGALAIVAHWPRVIHEFEHAIGPFGVSDKLAAVRGAKALIFDHWLTGIGRGAYESVYFGYQTSAVQLTFTHPENAVIQYVSEWGAPVGLAFIVGAGVYLLRRLFVARGWLDFTVVLAVVVVCLQNLADFSLELVALGLPVAVLVGVFEGPRLEKDRVPRLVNANARRWMLSVAMVVAAAVIALAGKEPMARDAVDLLSRKIRSEPPAVLCATDVFEAAHRRHPAHPVIACQTAYVFSVCGRQQDAMRWANQCLFLGPGYSDGYLLAARLLVTGGHRKQGFELARKAIRLSGSQRLRMTTDSVFALVRGPSDLVALVAPDSSRIGGLDPEGLGWLVRQVAGRPSLRPIFSEVIPLLAVNEMEETTRLAFAFTLLEHRFYAATATILRTLATDGALQGRAALAAARLIHEDASFDGLATLPEAIDGPEAPVYLELGIRAALRRGRIDTAETLLTRYQAAIAETPKAKITLDLLDAEIAERSGDIARALIALDRTLESFPYEASARKMRIRLLQRIGRDKELEYDKRRLKAFEEAN